MQAMSAFGPIVIEPPSEKEEAKKAIPVEWDEDLIMMLSDGYHVSIVSPDRSHDHDTGLGTQDHFRTR
jgi:hypothetical protein